MAQLSSELGAALQGHHVKLRWYAAYTRANHEKRVIEQLQRRNIENFVPLYEKLSRWKDRRVRLQLPLFSGYVFVRMVLAEKLRVLEVPSVVHLVGFGGLPSPLPDEEISFLRGNLLNLLHSKPHPFLTVGRRVRIARGSLEGLEGILVRRKSGARLVVSIALIQRSIAVEVDAEDVVPLPNGNFKPANDLPANGNRNPGRNAEN